ncbi:MAG: DUF3795 domain-containing protein [Bacilli bacterium]|nr:DUF3795 domain-containing protein [Bacilli bacterium]MDD3896004.1 DUF3795 domain-containing protein [Bacilli bacterium]MDD4407930.1 DUF3795 domain-containing protein [Bacilli bacterium]
MVLKIKEKEDLIAPCGMNCSLCIAYIFNKFNLNKEGFHKKYCPGCIARKQNCVFALGKKCDLIANGKIRFCYECNKFPCEGLKRLDKRYRAKYNMSMIDNLNCIKENGIDQFIKKEIEKWKCKTCGESKCCHNGLCLNC